MCGTELDRVVAELAPRDLGELARGGPADVAAAGALRGWGVPDSELAAAQALASGGHDVTRNPPAAWRTSL